MSSKKIKRDIPKYLSYSFYEKFFMVDPIRFKTKKDVVDHIYGNVMKLKRLGKPEVSVERGYMPQYDVVGVKAVENVLTRGKVNIKYPYVKK